MYIEERIKELLKEVADMKATYIVKFCYDNIEVEEISETDLEDYQLKLFEDNN